MEDTTNMSKFTNTQSGFNVAHLNHKGAGALAANNQMVNAYGVKGRVKAQPLSTSNKNVKSRDVLNLDLPSLKQSKKSRFVHPRNTQKVQSLLRDLPKIRSNGFGRREKYASNSNHGRSQS